MYATRKRKPAIAIRDQRPPNGRSQTSPTSHGEGSVVCRAPHGTLAGALGSSHRPNERPFLPVAQTAACSGWQSFTSSFCSQPTVAPAESAPPDQCTSNHDAIPWKCMRARAMQMKASYRPAGRRPSRRPPAAPPPAAPAQKTPGQLRGRSRPCSPCLAPRGSTWRRRTP